MVVQKDGSSHVSTPLSKWAAIFLQGRILKDSVIQYTVLEGWRGE
jgi:hypothetical protein